MPMALPEPLIPNAANQMTAYRDGYGLGQNQLQTQTLQDAGNLAASGDMRGGANAMMRGGLVAEGQQMLDKISQAARTAKKDALEESMRKIDIIAGVAQRTPDEQWAPTMTKMVELGLVDGKTAQKYADPSTRDIIIGQSSQAQDIFKQELERRKLDISDRKNDLTERKLDAAIDGKAAGALSDDALNTAADIYIQTGKMPPLGQGNVGSTNRAKVMETVTKRGGSANDMVSNQVDLAARTAGAKTGGSQGAKMDIAAQEITNLAPLALKTMKALSDSRGAFLPYNQVVEAIQKGTNDPRVREAAVANQSLVSNYAAVIGRGSPQISDSAREHAENLLKTTFDYDSYERVVKFMMQEADIAKKAPGQIREQNRKDHGGTVAPPASGGGAIDAMKQKYGLE